MLKLGRVLAVQGQVLPSTLHNVSLVADVRLPDKNVEVRIKGESQIPKIGGKIRRVWMEPGNPAAFPPTIQAILNADLIVVGPGSLYTSIVANLLVPDLVDALRPAGPINSMFAMLPLNRVKRMNLPVKIMWKCLKNTSVHISLIW